MMEQAKFEKLKEFIIGLLGKYDVKDLVAEVHNLFQEYLISESQEEELYKLVDPDDKENSPAELWYAEHGCLPIWNYVQ